MRGRLSAGSVVLSVGLGFDVIFGGGGVADF